MKSLNYLPPQTSSNAELLAIIKEFDQRRSKKARIESSDSKPKEEAARKAKEEAARKAREEAAKKAREEAARKAREEAARKAKEEAARKAKEEKARAESLNNYLPPETPSNAELLSVIRKINQKRSEKDHSKSPIPIPKDESKTAKKALPPLPPPSSELAATSKFKRRQTQVLKKPVPIINKTREKDATIHKKKEEEEKIKNYEIEMKKLKDQIEKQKNEFELKLTEKSEEIKKMRETVESRNFEIQKLKNQARKQSNEMKKLKFELLEKTKENEEQERKIINLEKQLKNSSHFVQKSSTEKAIQILDSNEIKQLEKVKLIGEGGSGSVYEVIKTETITKNFALKILNQNDQKRFQNFIKEYELLNLLDHPNVLKTFGIFLSDEEMPPSILLEHCPTNLEKMIKGKSIDKTGIILAVYQIVEGMKYIHSQKIIHRDLKPSNILVADDGTIKICDFGLSKIMNSEELEISMTKGIGTLFFMAPEILNEDDYNEKIDVYSFGVLLFFILSGGQMPKITIIQIGSGKKAKIPDKFTDFARDLINSCWNTDPSSRPSFQHICNELDHKAHQLLDLSPLEMHNVKLKIEQFKKQIPSY